jgi:regulator of cell morphogenesis and NO signaling
MRADATKTVREVALEVPSAVRVFENLGIDYCCGGSKPLGEACAAAKVSLPELLEKLEAAQNASQTSDTGKNWQSESQRDLVRHIIDTHHGYIRAEVPRLLEMSAKVASKHGPSHPEVIQVQEIFEALAQEIEMHLFKEEHMLFPYIVELDDAVAAGQGAPQPMFGTVQNPVRMMLLEHDSAGTALRELRQVTSNYTVPPDACVTFLTLYRELQAFEADLHQHIHLENNILFPRAIEMESSADQRATA